MTTSRFLPAGLLFPGIAVELSASSLPYASQGSNPPGNNLLFCFFPSPMDTLSVPLVSHCSILSMEYSLRLIILINPKVTVMWKQRLGDIKLPKLFYGKTRTHTGS